MSFCLNGRLFFEPYQECRLVGAQPAPRRSASGLFESGSMSSPDRMPQFAAGSPLMQAGDGRESYAVLAGSQSSVAMGEAFPTTSAPGFPNLDDAAPLLQEALPPVGDEGPAPPVVSMGPRKVVSTTNFKELTRLGYSVSTRFLLTGTPQEMPDDAVAYLVAMDVQSDLERAVDAAGITMDDVVVTSRVMRTFDCTHGGSLTAREVIVFFRGVSAAWLQASAREDGLGSDALWPRLNEWCDRGKRKPMAWRCAPSVPCLSMGHELMPPTTRDGRRGGSRIALHFPSVAVNAEGVVNLRYEVLVNRNRDSNKECGAWNLRRSW